MRNPLKKVVRSVARRAAGTGHIEDGLARMRSRLTAIDRRQRAQEEQLSDLGQRLQEIENHLRAMGDPVREVTRRQDRLETRVVADKVDPALARLSALEDEVHQSRQLNRRMAELTDLVGQLLLPSSDRDDQALRARLDAFDAH